MLRCCCRLLIGQWGRCLVSKNNNFFAFSKNKYHNIPNINFFPPCGPLWISREIMMLYWIVLFALKYFAKLPIHPLSPSLYLDIWLSDKSSLDFVHLISFFPPTFSKSYFHPIRTHIFNHLPFDFDSSYYVSHLYITWLQFAVRSLLISSSRRLLTLFFLRLIKTSSLSARFDFEHISRILVKMEPNGL